MIYPINHNDTQRRKAFAKVYFLILLREDNYDNGATWRYSVDVATPCGSYIDDFWDTVNDWCEGQRVEVVAYARFPSYLKESDLVKENENDD